MDKRKIIPIYTSRGDLGALMIYPHLFNPAGEWIGFVTSSKDVYSVLGHYVGYLGDGPRILRTRSYPYDMPKRTPPTTPPNLRVPITIPLAPMMSELPVSIVDILDEEPERLPTRDFGELRQDLD